MTGTPASYFEELWADSDDPWEHASRFYEARKYDLTVSALLRPRYRRAFEPACGVGLLTERLAGRVDRLEARDKFPRAVTETRRRVHDLSHVGVEVGDLLAATPEGPFDLVVISEVLYYFEADQVRVIGDHIGRIAEVAATMVTVHYRRPVAEHALSGDEVHEIVADWPGWDRRGGYVDDDFRLDVWTKR